MAPVPSIVLLSGGLDSAANLALCVERDQVSLVLTADYGQRAARREIQAACELCRYYGVPHEVVELKWLGALGGSSLTSASPDHDLPPEIKAQDLDRFSVTKGTAKQVWVPNRNGVLINVAASFAERRGAKRVVVGFNREEAVTFPDNSGDFLRRAGDSLALSTANGVEAFCYTTALVKTEIVALLRTLPKPFPFSKLWSCYLGGKTPCGNCESCQRLKRAIEA
jgi:7-cyano-7-deazaguanine synthase